MPADLLGWLDRLGNKDSVFVFTGAMGTPVPVNEISKVAPRLCAVAALPPVTFHDLRSFAASNLYALGVELLSIMEILGHTKLDTSLLYLNAQNAKKREGLQGLLNRLTERQTKTDAYLPTTGRPTLSLLSNPHLEPESLVEAGGVEFPVLGSWNRMPNRRSYEGEQERRRRTV